VFFILPFSICARKNGQESLWEEFHVEDGVTLFKSRKAEKGIIPFRAEAILQGRFEDYLKALMNLKDKNLWAPKLKETKLHQLVNSNTFIFSEYYKTPWPATDREFLLKGSVIFKGKKEVIFFAKSILKNHLKRIDHIQCDVREITLILREVNKNETFISFTFEGDMKGWMPTWLINLIQRRWPMRFIQALEKFIIREEVEVTPEYIQLKRVS